MISLRVLVLYSKVVDTLLCFTASMGAHFPVVELDSVYPFSITYDLCLGDRVTVA